jgi:hypothetical protein
MDNRKPPDTNVVQLRRNGDPSDVTCSGVSVGGAAGRGRATRTTRLW